VEIVERPTDLVDTTEYQLVNARRSRGGIVARERALGKDIRVKDQHRIEAGDFLLSCRQIIHGACGVVPPDLAGAVVSNEYIILRPREGVRTEYLQHLSHTRYFQRTCFHSSVGVDVEKMVFKIERWLNYQISIPPVDEQARIIDVLGAADEAIGASELVVEQLDRVRRALADDLLRHGLPGRGHRLRDSSIGKIPESWGMKVLSEVGQVQTGLAKGKIAAGDTVELPYLRVANVQDGYVDLEEVKTIVVERSALDRYRLRPGDVLFTEGGDFDKLGRGCVWRGQIDPCLHQNHVFAVRTGPELHPGFLAAHAASKRGRAYFLDCAKRTTNLASINSTQLKALPVPIPPLDEQQAIVDALAAVSDRVDRERVVLAERRRLKTALADALLTGQIRVPPTAGV